MQNLIKSEAIKTLIKTWIDTLLKYTKEDNPSWHFIGREARETLGQIYALWAIDLINDKEHNRFFNEIWEILEAARENTNIDY